MLSPQRRVRPRALEVADGEGAGAAAQWGTGGGPALQQPQVGSRPQETRVAVLLHQPVHRALRRLERAAHGLPHAPARHLPGVKVQVHLGEEGKEFVQCVFMHFLCCYPQH